jgi:two-component system phosphate regulon response regulator PhoB
MKILLVDDDHTMRSVLTTLLKLENYDVVSWSGQPDADILDQIRQEKPDVVLLDVHLREISGFDVLQQIKQDPSLANTKVLMTSGMAMQDECDCAGADGFLLKPYMPDELSGLLKKLL